MHAVQYYQAFRGLDVLYRDHYQGELADVAGIVLPNQYVDRAHALLRHGSTSAARESAMLLLIPATRA